MTNVTEGAIRPGAPITYYFSQLPIIFQCTSVTSFSVRIITCARSSLSHRFDSSIPIGGGPGVQAYFALWAVNRRRASTATASTYPSFAIERWSIVSQHRELQVRPYFHRDTDDSLDLCATRYGLERRNVSQRMPLSASSTDIPSRSRPSSK